VLIERRLDVEVRLLVPAPLLKIGDSH
jgi:hypothetical protein